MCHKSLSCCFLYQPLQKLIKPHVESFNYAIREGLNKAVRNILPVEFALPDGQIVELRIKVEISGLLK